MIQSRRMTRIVSAFCLVLIAVTLCSAQDSCRPALELAGRNLVTETSFSDQKDYYYHQVCEAHSKQEQTDAFGKYKEVIQLSFSKDFSEASNFCDSMRTESSHTQFHTVNSNTVVPQALEVWLKCRELSERTRGAFWYEPTEAGGQISITLHTGSNSHVLIKGVTVSSPPDPRGGCVMGQGNSSFPKPGTSIRDGNSAAITCIRATDAQHHQYRGVTMTVDNSVETFTLWFPPRIIVAEANSCLATQRIVPVQLTLSSEGDDLEKRVIHVPIAPESAATTIFKVSDLISFDPTNEKLEEVYLKAPSRDVRRQQNFSLFEYPQLEGFFIYQPAALDAAQANRSSLEAGWDDKSNLVALTARTTQPLPRPETILMKIVVSKQTCFRF
jgi:hypothetical protein